MKKRLIALAVSLALLAFIWSQVDPAAIWAAILQVAPYWFGAAVLFTIPLALATALRFQALSAGSVPFAQSIRLILAASTLNMVLPSKMGDIAKAWILRQRNGMSGSRAVALVVLEKMLDLWSLLAVGAVALLFVAPDIPALPLWILALAGGSLALLLLVLPWALPVTVLRRLAGFVPPLARKIDSLLDEWSALVRWFWSQPGKAAAILLASLLLWGGHMFQIWLFARAIGDVPTGLTMALGVIAILAGLLPFTFAGVGTRDAAFVLLFAPFLDPGGAALLGLFATLRYLLPALAGLPFVGDFWNTPKASEAR